MICQILRIASMVFCLTHCHKLNDAPVWATMCGGIASNSSNNLPIKSVALWPCLLGSAAVAGHIAHSSQLGTHLVPVLSHTAWTQRNCIADPAMMAPHFLCHQPRWMRPPQQCCLFLEQQASLEHCPIAIVTLVPSVTARGYSQIQWRDCSWAASLGSYS